MSRDELLELAPLDALGLLDEYEAALFQRAFHHAPASVQAEVVALQAEFAASEAFLADEEPRATLARKVLLRIEEEIEESNEQLRPIAQIGPPVAAEREAVRGGLREEDVRRMLGEFAARTAMGRERSTPFWRAAAIMLAAGLVVALHFLQSSRAYADEITRLAMQKVVGDQIKDRIPNIETFAAAGDGVIAFAPVGAGPTGSFGPSGAFLLIDRQTGTLALLGLGLHRLDLERLTLRAVDANGLKHEILAVPCDQYLVARNGGPVPAGFVAAHYELVDPEGNVLFTSERVVARA